MSPKILKIARDGDIFSISFGHMKIVYGIKRKKSSQNLYDE